MKTVVVVDDNVTNLKIAEKALAGTFKPILLTSGAQLLKYLGRNTPDLILLDISMPDMDGFETLQEMQKLPGTTDIPVIFLTANADADSEIRGLALGAVDFIAKPFVPQTMLCRIRTHLELAEYRKKYGSGRI